MTTKIRIEKADAASHYVMVQVQQVSAEGKWQNVGAPTALLLDQVAEEHIHQNKRVIVYELPLGNA